MKNSQIHKDGVHHHDSSNDSFFASNQPPKLSPIGENTYSNSKRPPLLHPYFESPTFHQNQVDIINTKDPFNNIHTSSYSSSINTKREVFNNDRKFAHAKRRLKPLTKFVVKRNLFNDADKKETNYVDKTSRSISKISYHEKPPIDSLQSQLHFKMDTVESPKFSKTSPFFEDLMDHYNGYDENGFLPFNNVYTKQESSKEKHISNDKNKAFHSIENEWNVKKICDLKFVFTRSLKNFELKSS